MIDVFIQGRLPTVLKKDELSRAFRATAKAIKRPASGSVSITFIDSEEMRRLNRTWRKKNKTTDVLSFATGDAFPAPLPEAQQIGDLFLDASYIREEARRRKISYREEILRNVIHGALHLYGYDHATLKEEKVMFGIQEKVVHSCGKRV